MLLPILIRVKIYITLDGLMSLPSHSSLRKLRLKGASFVIHAILMLCSTRA